MRGLGIQVVDLSADFRLRDIPIYQKWYGDHGDPDLLVSAVYGLPSSSATTSAMRTWSPTRAAT